MAVHHVCRAGHRFFFHSVQNLLSYSAVLVECAAPLQEPGRRGGDGQGEGRAAERGAGRHVRKVGKGRHLDRRAGLGGGRQGGKGTKPPQ